MKVCKIINENIIALLHLICNFFRTEMSWNMAIFKIRTRLKRLSQMKYPADFVFIIVWSFLLKWMYEEAANIYFFIRYNEFKTKYLYFSYLYLEILNNSKIATPFYLRTFISKMTFSLSGYVGTSSMKSKRSSIS